MVIFIFQISTWKRDFVYDKERPLGGQLHREGLHGRHPASQEVHLHREPILHGVGLRLARRSGRPLLQRHPNGDHGENLREHHHRKKVGWVRLGEVRWRDVTWRDVTWRDVTWRDVTGGEGRCWWGEIR